MRETKPILAALFRNLRLAAIAAAGASVAAFGQTKLAVDSPFAPAAGGPGGAAAAPQGAYELAGSSSIGSGSMVCIYDNQAKHSEWIAVGDSSGPIHVVSYDSRNDRAVVTISGERKELTLRKAVVIASTPARVTGRPVPVAAPRENPEPAPIASNTADAPPIQDPAKTTPEVSKTAHDQQEARMLVSDLLEIGAQQRKAYQDAKLKASQMPAQPSN